MLLLVAVASIGFLMLYSVAGGSMDPWAEPQMKRFAVGLLLMFAIAFVPIWFWRNMAGVAYAISVLLLLVVEFFGEVGMGAQRWIDLGLDPASAVGADEDHAGDDAGGLLRLA